jgi:hypothetical protein
VDLEGIWWVLIGFGGGEGVVIDQRRRRVMSGRERDATKKVGMDHARAGLGVCVCVDTAHGAGCVLLSVALLAWPAAASYYLVHFCFFISCTPTVP